MPSKAQIAAYATFAKASPENAERALSTAPEMVTWTIRRLVRDLEHEVYVYLRERGSA